LLYWLMALSFQVFGQSEASARLVSALSMLLLSGGLFFFCRGLGQARAGFYAALILSTSLPAVLMSRTILFDPLLTALLSACFLAFLQWYLERRRNRLMLAAAMLALAALTKGGVALALAAGVIGTFLWSMRDRQALRALADKAAIGLFFAIALPWHIAASLQLDGFAWFYFVNEHVLRYLGLREPHDYHLGPPYYYLPRLLVLLLPWTPFLALLVRSPAARDRQIVAIVRFCRAWTLFPLLFFSLSQAKAQYYILVLAPACALWLGIELERRLGNDIDKAVSHCLGLSMAVGAAALWATWHANRIEWESRNGIAVAAAGLLLAAVAWHLGVRWFAAAQEQRWLRDAAIAAAGLLMLPLLVLVLRIVDARSDYKSSRQVAHAIQRHGGATPVVFVYRDFEDVFSSLPFYLRQKVKVIDSVSRDLHFGCSVAPGAGNACISSGEFNHDRARFPVAVVVSRARVEDFGKTFGQAGWRGEPVGNKWVFFNR
jgi:4-amino-4-deoxy-L-arabinose transferase-like glycosyltransferase